MSGDQLENEITTPVPRCTTRCGKQNAQEFSRGIPAGDTAWATSPRNTLGALLEEEKRYWIAFLTSARKVSSQSVRLPIGVFKRWTADSR